MKEAKKDHRGLLCDGLTITEHCEATLNLMSHCFRHQCTAESSVQDLTTAAMCHQVLCVSNAEHSYEFMGWWQNSAMNLILKSWLLDGSLSSLLYDTPHVQFM